MQESLQRFAELRTHRKVRARLNTELTGPQNFMPPHVLCRIRRSEISRSSTVSWRVNTQNWYSPSSLADGKRTVDNCRPCPDSSYTTSLRSEPWGTRDSPKISSASQSDDDDKASTRFLLPGLQSSKTALKGSKFRSIVPLARISFHTNTLSVRPLTLHLTGKPSPRITVSFPREAVWCE